MFVSADKCFERKRNSNYEEKSSILAMFLILIMITGCGGSTSEEEKKSPETIEEDKVVEQENVVAEAPEETEPQPDEVEILVADGRDYWYGLNGKDKDNNKAEELFRQAVDKEDFGDAWYYIGEIQRSRYDYGEAIKPYEKTIDAGSELGRYALGYMYQHGIRLIPSWFYMLNISPY